MKKILFVANIDEHIRAFHLPYLKFFKNAGWKVFVASRGDTVFEDADFKYNIPLERFPFRLRNIQAFFSFFKIFRENHFDIVHFHTDTAHVIGLAALLLAGKKGTRVLFTSHGHFYYKGSPLRYWLAFFPVDTILSWFTDCLITINREDYLLSKRYQKAGRVEYVHGVGVNTGGCGCAGRKIELRRLYGYSDSAFILFYAAEFTKNKNQKTLIEAVSLLKDNLPELKLLLAGQDSGCQSSCRELCRSLGVTQQVEFLGFRSDIHNLLAMADAVTASSKWEGLPVNILEAMAQDVPVVATDNRGHRELIKDAVNGFITKFNDPRDLARKIYALCLNPFIAERFKAENLKRIPAYSIENVSGEMRGIYSRYM